MLTAYYTSLERSELANVISHKGNLHFQRVQFPSGGKKIQPTSVDCLVGYWNEPDFPARPPDFLVTTKSGSRDLFAWLATYLPAASPVSQWAHVFDEDAFWSLKDEVVPAELGRVSALWTGAVLGEVIAQTGGDSENGALSVGAATASSTFAVARSVALWGNQYSLEHVREKLDKARSLVRSAPRRLPAVDLEFVWDILSSLAAEPSRPIVVGGKRNREAAMALAGACRDLLEFGNIGPSSLDWLSRYVPIAREIRNLEAVNAERRVAYFDQAVASLEQKESEDEAARMAAEFVVAYLASRIQGGGTRNIQLIRSLAHEYPLTGVWYGIHIALGQFSYWSDELGGYGRLVQRELSYPFHLHDQPRADLGIDELEAIVPMTLGSPAIQFRGASAKTMSVQILPGVAINLSLQGLREQGVEEDGVRLAEALDKARVIGDLDAALERLWALRKSMTGGSKPITSPNVTSPYPRRGGSGRSKKGSGGTLL